MRDQIKTFDYFKKSLNFTNESIEQFQSLIREVVDAQGEDCVGARNGYNTMVFYYTERINLEYSIGESIDVIKKTFLELLKYYSKMWDLEYGYTGLVRVLSVGFMLNVESVQFEDLQKKIIELKLNDYLVNFLMRRIDESWHLNSQSFVFPGFYEPLKEIIDNCDDLSNDIISQKILSYLNDYWYSSNSEEAWYDSHKSKNDVYYGYWCYEMGAVVKALDIEDSQFKNQVYYPYDLVHY